MTKTTNKANNNKKATVKMDYLKSTDPNVFDFSKMDAVKKATIAEYIKAVEECGKIALQYEKDVEKLKSRYSKVLEKSTDKLTEKNKESLKKYAQELEKLDNKKSDSMKKHRDKKKACIDELFGKKARIYVEHPTTGDDYDSYEAYCYGIEKGKMGLFKENILKFFQSIGVASDRANYGRGDAKDYIEGFAIAFGMVTTSDKVIVRDGVDYTKAMTRAKFNALFMGHLINVLRYNEVLSRPNINEAQA